MLIGGGLISSGIKYIGGGVFCAENQASREAAFGSGPQLCTENGEVVLGFGAPQYVGLGFSVLAMAVLIQFFGALSRMHARFLELFCMNTHERPNARAPLHARVPPLARAP
eukprot:2536492-Pleurochrysis_carterae.AAC.1